MKTPREIHTEKYMYILMNYVGGTSVLAYWPPPYTMP